MKKRQQLLLVILVLALPVLADVVARVCTRVPNPIDTPGQGTYASAQTVALSDSGYTGAGLFICYTMDGSTPWFNGSSCGNGTQYTGTFSTGASTVTIKYIACGTNYSCSALQSSTYTIGAGTWSLVQHVIRDNPVACQSATSCAFTNGVDGFVTPTAGNVGIIFAGTFTVGEGTGFNTVTNGGTWTEQTGAESDLVVNPGSNHQQWTVATTLSLVADSTITLNLTVAPSGGTYHFIELHWSGSTTAVDVVNKNTLATCTSCAGLALTLTGSADVIIQGIAPENGCTAISGGAGYTSFGDFASFGNALAGQINTTTATAPTWTCSPTGTAAVTAISIKGS